MPDASRSPLMGLAALLLAALACNVGGTDEPADTDQVATAVAETLAVQRAHTSTAAAQPLTSTPTPEPVDSPTVTLTATLAATATPSVPMVSVSIDTNCRIGPGIAYDYRGALLVGETTEVVARSTVGNYWYVVNPDRPGEFCYLWGQYATVVGDTGVLPAFTPPPSPTPTYTPTATATATYTPIP